MSIKSDIPLTFGRKNQADFDLTYNNIPADADFFCQLHRHGCFELISMLSGEFTLNIDGSEFTLTAGDIAILPPYLPHGTASPLGCSSENIVLGYTETLIYTPDISFSNIKYLAPFRQSRKPSDYIFTDHTPALDRFRELMCDAKAIYLSRSSTRDLKMRSLILDVHSIIYDLFMYDYRRSAENEQLLDVQLYIEQHICEDISPYEIADALHISYSHLARIVKGTMGISLGELIRNMRMNLAEQLMSSDTSLSITDAAMSAGFSNVSYFIKQFRKVKGCTPGEFRKIRSNSKII